MIIEKIINFIFPTHCLFCEKIINRNSSFCHKCWTNLQFIKDPKCPICSYPFEIEIPTMQPFCAKCLSKKPSYDKIITIFRYNFVIKKIIANFKYHKQTYLAKKIAQIILPKLINEINENDIMVAVPLHFNKLKIRKFNQANMISQQIYKKLPIKPIFYHDLIFRNKDTKPQVLLRGQDRITNLKKAFIINKKYLQSIKDRRIFLVDDIVTTGSTVESCAKTLKKKGAKEVIVVCLAKTAF